MENGYAIQPQSLRCSIFSFEKPPVTISQLCEQLWYIAANALLGY